MTRSSGTPPAPAPAEPYPSLAVVERELNRAEVSHQQHAQGLDTKAGLVLGAAGVIVALAVGHRSLSLTGGQVSAVAAGVAAARAFLPRTGGIINPSELQERYLDQPERTTRLTLLATRVDLFQADEEALKVKFLSLRVAVVFLLVAAVDVCVGSIVDVL